VLLFASVPSADATLTFRTLTLLHGWTGAPFSTANPGVANIGGIVTFKGAMSTTGTNAIPFRLPLIDRPTTVVYVAVDLCNSNLGRLLIEPTGFVTVEAESGAFANAACFTSLDGVSFDRNAATAPLTLINGWTGGPFSTAQPGVVGATTGGIVRLAGAMATTGSNASPFVLPVGYRPPATVWVPVDLCNTTNGRLIIGTNGAVTVEAENGTFANAACFTSLDGVSFAKTRAGFSALSLLNGWTNSTFGGSAPAVRKVGDIVHLEGAMSTSGTTAEAFVLPAADDPSTDVYVGVDLCGATNGRLLITTGGQVSVQAETSFSDAQCFTSLDGASFAQ
jgi:hypothetical protein